MTAPLFTRGLSQEEETKVVELAYAVADAVKASPAHQLFCSRGTYVRYLRARSWNVHKAARMLTDTLKWRAAFRPEALRFEALAPEAARGKVYVLAHPDNDGRPVVFMRPRKEVYGGDNEERLKWVVYVMEQASALADASSPDGKMAWLIDYVGYNRRNQPPWKVSLQTLQIVQNHYPERLGRAVNFQPPFLFDLFWKAIRPFVDPVTRDKLVFLHQGGGAEGGPEAMGKYFDVAHLDEPVGGLLPEEGMWDYEVYRKRMQGLEAELEERLAPVADGASGGAANGSP